MLPFIEHTEEEVAENFEKPMFKMQFVRTRFARVFVGRVPALGMTADLPERLCRMRAARQAAHDGEVAA